ncbi:3174_t:CDS:2 [Gigaspora rosea]|nr:3174_t:CDS:2 [Gigaspora rosea]
MHKASHQKRHKWEEIRYEVTERAQKVADLTGKKKGAKKLSRKRRKVLRKIANENPKFRKSSTDPAKKRKGKEEQTPQPEASGNQNDILERQ